MPYIDQESRKRFDPHIEALVDQKVTVGELNYIISKMIWTLWNRKRSYTLANNLIGVLECVKAEFYRRFLSPYEDIKIQENGDVECDLKR